MRRRMSAQDTAFPLARNSEVRRAPSPVPGLPIVSVLATGGDRFDRRHALPSHWKELEADLARLPASALDRSSTIVRLLLDVDRRSNVVVQSLTGVPTDGEPERSAQVLDALLKGMAARPEMR